MKRAGIAVAFVAALGLMPNVHGIAETATAVGEPGKKTNDVGEEGKKEKDGKWYTADGTPTYHISSDGTVDWYTFSGFRRYHAECHTCHGPDGEGSTYAPGLVQSLKTMSYPEFMLVVATGRTVNRPDIQSAMPALGTDRNVACFLDDIYVYLKARADGGLPRGRPAKRAEKPGAAEAHEKACLG